MIGVIGAGKMGIQLVRLLSKTENVIFVARDIDKAKSDYAIRYPSEMINSSSFNDFDRIEFTHSISELAACKIVFECLPEIFDLKINYINNISKTFFGPIASCTSTISLGKMKNHLVNADKVNVVHFSNPISSTKIAEVVFAENIDNNEKTLIANLLAKLSMDYVEVPDIDGFVINSLLFPLLYKSIQIHMNFAISKFDIDNLMKKGCKFPMGPFEIINLVGVDTVLAVFKNLNLEVDSNLIAALKK
jgi:3-hydroxybutyryl-CoA dehydrogenase